MAVKYVRIPPDELRQKLRGGGVFILAVPKKGRESKMPLVSGGRSKKAPLELASLEAVSGDGTRCKLTTDAGGAYWVDCDDLLFHVDEL